MIKNKYIASLLIGFMTNIIISSSALAENPRVIFGKNKPVTLEVAATPEAIMHGLMYRTSLEPDSGMIFLFNPPQKVQFWMYHTLIPLDMVFIQDKKIVKIFANVQPCKSEKQSDCPLYPPKDGIFVNEVIELNANYCKEHNVKVGDEVIYKSPM